jgi:hypothetical protein
MSDWKVFYRDDHRRDAQSTHTSKEAAIVQALHLERRQHSRIQIIEGQNGELIDRETFEREYLKKTAPLSEAPASRRPERGACTLGVPGAAQDRGKPMQAVKANVSVFDQMTDDEQKTMLAALEALRDA